MRILLLFVIITASLPSSANLLVDSIASAASNGLGESPYRNGIIRLSGGLGQTEIYRLTPNNFEQLNRTKGWWGEVDLGLVLFLHYGFSGWTNKEMRANFNNTGLRDAQFQMKKYQYGLKIILPIPVVNPWVGAGGIAGSMIVQSVGGTGAPAYEDRRIMGAYWHAGLDLLLTPFVGLRASYQNERIRSTADFVVFSNTRMEFYEHVGQAGLILYF